ncbi:MAG: DUF4369 domain-containing protein [Bacteroidaceae bacterium]|nr:DUF4369 domain-containing protein [Bacteroidaceae bacterium]
MLFACSGNPGQVRITGDFANLEQGEFYIYSINGVIDRLDTIKIQEGEFEYVASIEGEAIFRLMYPNFSELTIFARPGDEIRIKGDAQNLNAVQVNGTEDNEVYTEFREQITDLSDDKVCDIARKYLLKYSTLPLSRYLFSTYFLLNDSISQTQVTELFDSLCRACPDDVELTKLSRRVRSHGLLCNGQQLPDFKLKTRPSASSEEEGVEISNEDFRGNYLLMAFWASWKSGSQSALYRTRRFRREMKEKGLKVNAISYSLDTESSALKRIEENDSIDYYSYCDYQCFNSLLVQNWGICDLPYFVLADSALKIIASGSDWQRDIEPNIQKLCL